MGSYWMGQGVTIALRGDFKGVGLLLEQNERLPPHAQSHSVDGCDVPIQPFAPVAMTVPVREWGRLPTGEQILMARLADASGLEVRIMNYGATVTSIRCRDRADIVDEVVLGFDSFLDYLRPDLQARWPYLGSTLGRYANRIAGASFVIDGTRYALSANDGRNHLHGGLRGFDRAVWTMHPIAGANGVALSLVSPDGEQGYPGHLDVHLDILLEAWANWSSATAPARIVLLMSISRPIAISTWEAAAVRTSPIMNCKSARAG